MNTAHLTIESARRALDAGEFSARELTEAYLQNIADKDDTIHAYLEVWRESALQEADVADMMIKNGTSKSLTGIPFAIKDNILIKGRIASSGSKILEKYVAVYDASVIEKLRAQGVVFLGRTNMDEFALGSSTENSAYGPTKNPHDISRVPGGTSGGSAAAIAANMALGALGSDTGGSIRQPSALCGVVGLKVTYGAVSRYGLMAAASSLDQIGPIAKNVADAKIIFDAIRGPDDRDSTTVPSLLNVVASTPKTIGVPRVFVGKGIDPDVLTRFENTLEDLRSKGFNVVDIDIPSLQYSLAMYYIINPAEVSTNLERYDGIRYGLRESSCDIGSTYFASRSAGFGAETRRRVLVGTFVLSSGYADAYYRKARAAREVLRADFAKAFEHVDAIVVPTTPTPAFKIGKNTSDPLAMYLEDVFTVPVNLAGVPAISVPMGSVERDGVSLPLGFQIIASHGHESHLFEIGSKVAI